MVVYIDLIFLTNLLIDGTVLWTTAWMRKIRPKFWRIAAAACIGASYVVMMFVPALSFMFTFLIKFVFSLVMLWTAFGFGSLQNYLRNLGAFYIVNFAAAGGIFGVHYLLQSSGEIFNGIWYSYSGGLSFELKVGFLFTAVGFAAMILFYKTVIRSRDHRENITRFTAEVEVSIEGETARCTGLIDTGNQLTDPLTRTPVMIMEAATWGTALPERWASGLKEMQADQFLLKLDEEACKWSDRLRLVPYRGVNRGTQFMLAVKPDKVSITYEGTTEECTKVLIGLDGGKLSSDGTYQAIIHPALLQTLSE
ncbi:sigma-E processing peptidase SpoIIGA [Paenibacillus sp. MSJ-34]|nr:sigma-E processing peptidase SpoIIGA [Paenibacillus sp. MSJ-34]MBU5440528.1 sigma-E processing peptidase SpoIIGA [Paenibacillus sp. MSJ-34]